MFRISCIITIILFTTTVAYAHVNLIYMSIAPKEIEYHLEDNNGLITGYTPNGILKEITDVREYYYRAAEDLGIDENPGPYQKFHLLKGNGIITSGKYKVVIYGVNKPIISHLSIDIRWSEKMYNRVSHTNNNFFIYPNAIWIYELDIPATIPANNQLVLIKTSTPTDLIKDLTTAGQLDYIGNPKFVSELTKEINEIEKNKILYEKDDTAIPPNQITKKEYQKLLTKITERYNKPEADKFVKKEAYTVLKEDLEYIIGHL